MAGNGSRHGDAKSEELSDKYERKNSETQRLLDRAQIRAELSSEDWDHEDSKLIRQEVDRRLADRRIRSDPPPLTSPVKVWRFMTNGWPPVLQLILLLVLIFAIVTRPEIWKLASGLLAP